MNISGGELSGVRKPSEPLVGHLATQHLDELWTRATSRIVKYGFAIEYRHLEPPRTGTFDGLQILIDPDVGSEMQCFILLHLFGHSVQWVAPSLEHKLHALQHTLEKEHFLHVLRDYEFEAAQFGLQLLHDVGVTHLDPWYSDFVATDWRYVERYYREDKIPPWGECVATDQPIVQPAAIPPLKLRQVQVRFAF
jgi:hypothetical protein